MKFKTKSAANPNFVRSRPWLVAVIFSGLLPTLAQAQKAVLIEEAPTTGLAVEKPAAKDDTDESNSQNSFPQKHSEKHFSTDSTSASADGSITDSYDSTYSMRSDRRVGVGFLAGGQLGMLGVDAELNFALDDSAVFGFGGGPQYSSFELGWRHVFAGQVIAPYVGATYSRWYNNSSTGGSIDDTTPYFLGQRFLSDGQHRTGKFGVNLVSPSGGLQFNILKGDYAGTSIFAEVMMLLDVDNFQGALTGAFGVTYYF